MERIGHAVGGVCPFALPEDVKTYLDESLRRFDTVFPAVGLSLIHICGPVIGGVVQQFWGDVLWQDVDYMLSLIHI